MGEARVRAVGIDAGTERPVVLLEETEGAGRIVPVSIGEAEAVAAASALEGLVPSRPDTHRLLASVLEAFGRRLRLVRVSALRDSVFHAELEFDDGTVVDARTSDAVVLALHARCRIEIDESVLDAAGVAANTVAVEGGPDPSDEMTEFRKFLDTAVPDDFDQS